MSCVAGSTLLGRLLLLSSISLVVCKLSPNFVSRQETTFLFGGDGVSGLIVVGVSVADGVMVGGISVFCSRRRR